MNGKYTVYKHTAPNGKVYIGITSRNPEQRWRKDGSGYTTSPHFYSAIQKYGWENIAHEIVQGGLTREEAGEMEKNLIAKYDSANRNFGYNQTFGGDFGLKITPEIRKKISDSNKKFYSNPSEIEALRKRATGYNHSEEAKRKMSEHHKGLTHVATDEWKNNISASLKKHYQDPKNREKHIDDFARLAKVGLEKSQPVEQIDGDGNVICTYKSMKEAFRATGIRDGNISKCCHGKAKSAGGYSWRYAR